MSAPIFISYSSKDQKMAATIAQALEARGQRCWISSRDVRAGDNFQEAIVRALREAKVMLLVFSANANNSDEIKKELVLAGRARVTVVPVRVEDVVPNDAFSYELATRQWVDLFQDWETQIEQLVAQVEMILAAPGDAPPPPRPITVPQTKEKSGMALIAALVILALLIGGGALAWLKPWESKNVAPAVVATAAPAPAPPAAMAAPAQAPAPAAAPPSTQSADASTSGSAMKSVAAKVSALKGEIKAIVHKGEAPAKEPQKMAMAMAAAPATVAPVPAPAAQPAPAAAPQDPDEAAWQNASRTATRESYNEYVRNFSGGVHLAEAQLALANMILDTPATGSAFDGSWQTTWTCPDRPGFPGYSYRYEGSIRNGVYHGSRGEKGQPSSMFLDGHVDSDGLAAFFGQIIVGSSITGMGAARGTLSEFHAMAHFDASGGSGKRLEGRTCTLNFARG